MPSVVRNNNDDKGMEGSNVVILAIPARARPLCQINPSVTVLGSGGGLWVGGYYLISG